MGCSFCGRIVAGSELAMRLASGAEAAIDIEHRAGHERGIGAGEEHDAGGDLFRGAVTLQRVLRALGFGEGAVLRVHVGVDRARLQHVDGDAARAEVARGALAVADDRGLAWRRNRQGPGTRRGWRCRSRW